MEDREGKKSEPVSAGQVVFVEVPPPAPLDVESQDIPLAVVFEDEFLLVVNKAAGMVVHPAPGHSDGTLVNALLHHVRDLSGIGGKLRPGIVHRLDRDTSGLMLVAKGDETHVALSNAIRRREVRRVYGAVAWGQAPGVANDRGCAGGTGSAGSEEDGSCGWGPEGSNPTSGSGEGGQRPTTWTYR